MARSYLDLDFRIVPYARQQLVYFFSILKSIARFICIFCSEAYRNFYYEMYSITEISVRLSKENFCVKQMKQANMQKI